VAGSRQERALADLPWRGPGEGRPELPLPPDGAMPLLGPGRRLRKRWRYVGVFCEEFMLCAARVAVGPARQTFWAVHQRGGGEPMLERTRQLLPRGRGEVWSTDGAGRPWRLGSPGAGAVTRVESGGVAATLRISEGPWAESVCPNGEGGWVWTRKRVAPVVCELRLPDGRKIEREAWGIEDESAGYHPRRTVWSWSAGVGESADGRPVGWNLVSGVNDPFERSERAIWLAGETSEPAPVRFDGLDGVEFAAGERLAFVAEAERRDRRNLGFVRYSYRQPFGTFSGTLPGGVELASGFGVMELHDALW
jgi:hypothetical protein